MESFKVSNFSAGITDGYLSSKFDKFSLLDNFVIDEEGKPYTRFGTFVHDYRIDVSTSSKRISGLLLSSEPYGRPLGFRKDKAYVVNGSDTWTEILGPTGNNAMPSKTDTDLESFIEWRKQVIVGSAPSTTLAHRIYCKTYASTPTFYSVTLGLPALETDPTLSSAGGSGSSYIYSFHRTCYIKDYDGTIFEETGDVTSVEITNVGAPNTNNITISAIATLTNTSSTNYDTPTVSKSSVTTSNGSPTLSGLSSTTDLIEGMAITGTGIPVGAVISSLTSSTVVMDRNATASGTVTITFNPLIVKVFRTSNNGQVAYFLDVVPNGTTSYVDSTSDTTISDRDVIYTDGDVLPYSQPPTGSKYVTVVGDIFWYATDRVLTHSIAGAPGACPVDFQQPMEQKVMGLSDILSFPILFCDRSIYRVEGFFDDFGDGGFDLKEISKTAGLLSHKSIVKIPGGLVFAGNGGFYFTDGYQVLKISEDLPVRYDTWKNTSICGIYDSVRDLVLWTVSSSRNNQFAPNDSLAILHLKYGITARSVFTTMGSPNNIYPTALAFSSSTDVSTTWRNKMMIGEARGYLLYQDEKAFTDPEIDEEVYPTAFTKKAIIYRLESPGYEFKGDGKRQYVKNLAAEFDVQTEMATQFLSRRDDGGPWSTLSEIVSEGTITWGITEYTWDDLDIHDWNSSAIAEGKRDFPAGTLRSTRRQIGLTNSKTWLSKSDDLGLATTDTALKTVTLNTVSSSWPEDCEDYEILFDDDSYVLYYKIKSRDSDTVITVYDPYDTLPTGVTLGWQIRGYRKFERVRLLSYTIFFGEGGMTQTPNFGNTGRINV